VGSQINVQAPLGLVGKAGAGARRKGSS